MMTKNSARLNLLDYERSAKESLTQMACDYYASGAGDEVTIRDDRAAYERIKLLARMLVDVSQIDLSTIILGEKLNSPIFISPTAFHRLAHPDGELARSRPSVEHRERNLEEPSADLHRGDRPHQP